MTDALNAHNPVATLWWRDVVMESAPSPRPTTSQSSERDEFDVIVAGAGMAGYCCAIFAQDRGLSVLILEAAEGVGGTTFKSGAGMWFPDNAIRRARGLPDDRDWAIKYMARLAFPETFDPAAEQLGLQRRDYEMITTFYDTASEAMDGLQRAGLALMEFPSFTGAYEAMVDYHNERERGSGTHLSPQQPDGGWGAGAYLIQRLAELADARGIEVRVRHRVTAVLTDEHGAVTGVVVEAPTGTATLFARSGVMFATGGYAHNRELTTQYWPGGFYGSCAVKTARGDFIAIAEKLGCRARQHGSRLGYPAGAGGDGARGRADRAPERISRR